MWHSSSNIPRGDFSEVILYVLEEEASTVRLFVHTRYRSSAFRVCAARSFVVPPSVMFTCLGLIARLVLPPPLREVLLYRLANEKSMKFQHHTATENTFAFANLVVAVKKHCQANCLWLDDS